MGQRVVTMCLKFSYHIKMMLNPPNFDLHVSFQGVSFQGVSFSSYSGELLFLFFFNSSFLIDAPERVIISPGY